MFNNYKFNIYIVIYFILLKTYNYNNEENFVSFLKVRDKMHHINLLEVKFVKN